MKHLLIVISMLAAFAAAFTACSGSGVSRSLLQAEAVMEEDPDSALRILESFRRDSLRPALSNADSAKFALLYTQALIKNDTRVDDDSLIRVAVKFHSDRKESTDLMKALFYKAQVEYNRGDMAAAIVPAMRARELAIGFDDSYWRAKAAEIMADIYATTYNKEECIDLHREASHFYEKAGRIDNHRYALCDLAIALSNNHQDDNYNVRLLDSIRNIANSNPVDTPLIFYADNVLLPTYIDLGRIEEAKKTLDEMQSLSKYTNSLIYTYMAKLALKTGNESAALHKIRIANKKVTDSADKVAVYIFYRDYYKYKGMSREAEAYTDSILTLQNIEVAAVLKQSVVSAQRDFFTVRAKKESDKARMSAMTATVLGTLLAAVCIGFLLYYREKMRRKKAEIEAMMIEAQTLSARLDEKEESLKSAINELSITRSDLNALSKTVSDKDSLLQTQAQLLDTLFGKRLQTLNSLSKDYFTLTDSQTSKTGIVRDFRKELESMGKPESQAELEQIVNNIHNNIITRLRKQFPKIKDQDILFLTLMMAGVTRNAICLITENKPGNYYNKYTRLKKRIADSDAPDRQEFLDTIFK